jgi:hypothetical protein
MAKILAPYANSVNPVSTPRGQLAIDGRIHFHTGLSGRSAVAETPSTL